MKGGLRGEGNTCTLEACPNLVPGLATTGVETVRPLGLFRYESASLDAPTLSTFALFEEGAGSKAAGTGDTTGGMEPGPTVSTLPAGVIFLK